MWSRIVMAATTRGSSVRNVSSSSFWSAGNARPILLAATVAVTGYLHHRNEDQDDTLIGTPVVIPTVAYCDFDRCGSGVQAARILRKRTTLEAATANPKVGSTRHSVPKTNKKSALQRLNTKEELDKLRANESEMLLRWERDEDGWRELPSRVWPPYQPNPKELQGIMAEITIAGCDLSGGHFGDDDDDDELDEECTKLLFDMATSFVFYNVNPAGGLAQYEQLAKKGHVDSMVACGIILVEGLGVPPREKEGIAWLEKAIEQSSSPQAYYELGTLYYTGVEGVLEEDPKKAFALFEKAAAQDHTAALYMVADCLVEGVGTKRSVARAVPLFHKAAERGHRFARQRIRELLARMDYPL